MAIRVQEAASLRLDEIYRYTRDRWGIEQAERYITELFAAFDQIESHGVASRPILAEFGVEGFYFRHTHHFVYWRRLSNGDVGIVTLLHERMHQMDRFREDSSEVTDASGDDYRSVRRGARQTLTRR